MGKLYLYFWNGVSKSRKKVVSKSLVPSPSIWVRILSSVIAVIHFGYLFVSLVHLRTYRHLSHTVLSCTVSCECKHYVRISEQRCLMLHGDYRYRLSVIVYQRPEWLSGLWNCKYVLHFYVFVNPKTRPFTFIELLQTFSRTLMYRLTACWNWRLRYQIDTIRYNKKYLTGNKELTTTKRKETDYQFVSSANNYFEKIYRLSNPVKP